jgi:hypothetical protein
VKTNLRFLLSLSLLICSLVFAQPSTGDGCPGEWCSNRSDGSLWCCPLKVENNCPCTCTYYNDNVRCRRSADTQTEESQSD